MGDSFHVECIMKRLPQIAQWIEMFDDRSKYTSEKTFHIATERTDDKFADDALRLEQYLLERLDEIRLLNQMTHSPVAISCILNYLYLIARLMIDSGKCNDVSINFCRFVNNFMRRISCVMTSNKSVKRSLDRGRMEGAQLNTFGAGLLKVGLGSVIPLEVVMLEGGKLRCMDENCPQITLAYGKLEGCASIDLMEGEVGNAHPVDLSGVSLEVNIYDLCDAIKRGIKAMFCDRTMVRTLLLQMENYSVLQKEEE